MMRTLSWNEARRLRLHAQGLGKNRARDVVSAARGCGAIQAQDRFGELLGVGVRSSGLTADDVDHARNVERSVARTWLLRGTLHLVASDDLRWMLDLLGAEMDRKARKRRADLGISVADHSRVLEFLPSELARRGPLTRAEIAESLRTAGLPWEDQATPHLLRSASMHGGICFGPDRGGETTHVCIDDWLPPAEPPADPAAELARRYFSAYGPAAPPDFRWWTGLPAADARQALAAISGELVEVNVEGKSMWMTAASMAQIDDVLEQPAERLRVVGPFDPYLLGYAKRELGVPDPMLKQVNAGGGMIRACLLLDGRLVGVWERKRRARDYAFTITALDPNLERRADQIDLELSEISRFLAAKVSWTLRPDPHAAKSA